ncbi:16852_t:CDS:1, partial [Cetraspora pellucida]
LFEQNEEINNYVVGPSNNFDNTTLDIFIKEVRNNYQNAGSKFCSTLNKFIEQYHASKLILIARLTSFLHNINSDINYTYIKSNAMILI